MENESEVVFYGKILDDTGLHIEYASVEFSYAHYSSAPPWYSQLSRGIVETNENGAFTIRGFKGRYLRINDIVKEGYEYDRSKNKIDPHFDYDNKSLTKHSVDPNSPIVFYLRKKLAPTILLHNSEKSIKVKKGDQIRVRYDIVKGVFEKSGRGLQYADLCFELNYESDPCKVKVRIEHSIDVMSVTSLGQPTDVANKEAEFSLYLKSNRKVEKMTQFLFVKSRSPVVSSQIKLLMLCSATACAIEVKSTVNPYGGDSFDEVVGIEPTELLKIKRDARDSLLRNQKPSRTKLNEYLKSKSLVNESQQSLSPSEIKDNANQPKQQISPDVLGPSNNRPGSSPVKVEEFKDVVKSKLTSSKVIKQESESNSHQQESKSLYIM
ncbi:MAG: hypothetical protein HQL32_17955 [Planctomycetes bacterium]|nr:hypothetical protein [Planctomycetota bacterium]